MSKPFIPPASPEEWVAAEEANARMRGYERMRDCEDDHHTEHTGEEVFDMSSEWTSPDANTNDEEPIVPWDENGDDETFKGETMTVEKTVSKIREMLNELVDGPDDIEIQGHTVIEIDWTSKESEWARSVILTTVQILVDELFDREITPETATATVRHFERGTK